MESTDNSKTAVKRKIGELPSADARCRVSVSHGMATFYADGRAMGSFRMQKSTVAAQVRRTGGSGSVVIRKNRDRYYYEADGIAEFYEKFGDKLPAELKSQLATLKNNLK